MYSGAAALGLLLFVCPVLAQPADESSVAAARELGKDGIALYQRTDYIGATEKLERAYAVVKVPTLGLWSGRALEKLGKLVEASQRYRETTLMAQKPSDPAIFRSAQADAQKAYEALASRIPKLTVELEGATAGEVSVTVDGKPMPSALIGAPLPVNPGMRKVEGRRGKDVATEERELREGERGGVTLRFEAVAIAQQPPIGPPPPVLPPPPPPDAHSSVVPWVVIVGGGAVAVTGAVFVALGLSATSSVEGVKDGTKWSAVRGDYNHASTYATVGAVMLGAGVAAVAAGLVWKYALTGKGSAGSEKPAVGGVSVEAGARGVALKGKF